MGNYLPYLTNISTKYDTNIVNNSHAKITMVPILTSPSALKHQQVMWLQTCLSLMGVAQTWGYPSRGPYNKECSILGSVPGLNTKS